MATFKQQVAARLMVEKGRSASAAMREAGYSPASATAPSKLTRSVGFNELLEKYLPEHHLLKKHKEFLNAPRKIRTYVRGELKEETEETDPNAVKALDMAYKLKGKYQDKAQNNVLIVNVSSENSARYAPKPVESTIVDTIVDTEKGIVDT